jgi:hypothetical protein
MLWFLVILGCLAIADGFAHGFLHLECLGPNIQGWGCLADVYPKELIGAGEFDHILLRVTGILVILWVAAYALADQIVPWLALVACKLVPGMGAATEPEQKHRPYRLR